MDQSLVNYLINLILLISEFSFETDELIEALTLVRYNILHPTILNYIELRHHLEIIKNSFGSTQTLPININYLTSIEEFLKLLRSYGGQRKSVRVHDFYRKDRSAYTNLELF